MANVRLVDLAKQYQRGDELMRALDGVTLNIDKGEFVAVVGRSGSGKATMLDLLGLLVRFVSRKGRRIGGGRAGLEQPTSAVIDPERGTQPAPASKDQQRCSRCYLASVGGSRTLVPRSMLPAMITGLTI